MLATALVGLRMIAAKKPQAYLQVIDLKDGDNLTELMDEMDADFGFFSIYESHNANSNYIDSLALKALGYMTQQIADNNWNLRTM